MQGDSISQTSQEPHAAPIGCMPNATGHPSHSTRLRRCWPSTSAGTRVVASLILIHVGLLAWMAYRDSPTWDEVGHFAAGVSHWQSGVFCLYTVNPPLVRLVACAPVVLLMHPAVDLGPYAYLADSQIRSEFLAGRKLAQANGRRYFWLITVARWACIPFSLLGAWICFLWARELYGQCAGLLAMALWVFSPNILAHAHLITPDVGATSLGVAAAYVFWRWLRRPTWPRALAAGLVLGLAELAKATWIILFVLWPVMWLLYRWMQRPPDRPRGWRRETLQIGSILIVALWLLNLGYGFEGTFTKLGDIRFISQSLGGSSDLPRNGTLVRNRFANSWLGDVPMPLPENYLRGIDVQRGDFERTTWSFLRGQWRQHGWWYFYLYAILVKEPVGTWVLIALAIVLVLFCKGYPAAGRDELFLLIPLAAVLCLVSSQTGFNHHLRYVLPVFPFAFIWMSKVARSVALGHRAVAGIVGVALAGSIASSLWVFPHSLSYFSELVGGPTRGRYHLASSCMDWGQDLFYLKDWLDAHPAARPLHLAYELPLIDPRWLGIDYEPVPVGPASTNAAKYKPEELGPLPGWHAVAVNRLHNVELDWDYLLKLKPVAMAGYTIYIYHISAEEAKALRQGLQMSKAREEQAGPTPLGGR